jgi:hypothetical protein
MAVMLQKPKVALWPLEVEQNASDYTTAAEALEQCAPSELIADCEIREQEKVTRLADNQ